MCTPSQLAADSQQHRGTRVKGAGGTARAAVYALLALGLEVEVWNRTPQKVETSETLIICCRHLLHRLLTHAHFAAFPRGTAF